MEVVGRAVLSASESDGGVTVRFERDVIRRVGRLCAGAVRLTRNQQDAADLVQYTILHTYGGFGAFPEGTNPMAWLYRIMHDTWMALHAGGFRSSGDYPVTDRVLACGWRCSDEPTHSREREDADGRSARPQVSQFETLTRLMLRRSPSACGGVMGRRSECIDERGENP
jgi:DNA-directed RNA polymerase specialized sigma24 family protein